MVREGGLRKECFIIDFREEKVIILNFGDWVDYSFKFK